MEYQRPTRIQFSPATGGDLAENLQHYTVPYYTKTLSVGSSYLPWGRRVQTDPVVPRTNNTWTHEPPIEVTNHYIHRSYLDPIHVRNHYAAPDIAKADANHKQGPGGMRDAMFASDLYAGRRLSSNLNAQRGPILLAIGASPIDRSRKSQMVAISRDSTDVETARPCVSTNANLQQENRVRRKVERPRTSPRAPAATNLAHRELHFRANYQGRQSGGEPRSTYMFNRKDSRFRLFTELRTKKEREIDTCPQLDCITGRQNSATRLYTRLRKKMEKERQEAAFAERLPPPQPNGPVLLQAQPMNTNTNVEQRETPVNTGMTSLFASSRNSDELKSSIQRRVAVAESVSVPFDAECAAFTATISSLDGQVAPSNGASPSSLSSRTTCLTHCNYAERMCSQRLRQDCGTRDADLGCAVAQKARGVLEIVDRLLPGNAHYEEAAGDQQVVEGFNGQEGADEKAKL